MKHNYFFKARHLLHVGFLMIGSALSAQVYEIAFGEINATGVSNDGVVALYSGVGNYMWNPTDGLTSISDITNGYNNAGQPGVSNDGTKISGTITNPETDSNQMGLYDIATGTWTFGGDLGVIMDGATSSAWSISGDGKTIVGLGWTGVFQGHAIYWNEEEGTVDLGSSVSGSSSRANGVNYDGSVIVGWQDLEDGYRQAAIWRNGEQTLIYDQEDYELTEAGGVSDDGIWVIGGDLGFSAWRWSEETGVIALSHPEEGPFFRGAATAINQDGSVIVGFYRPWPGPAYMGEGFIWTEELGVTNLDSYIDSIGMDRNGISFALPLGISANGRHIVGNGTDSSNNIVAFMISLDEEMGIKELNTSSVTYYPNPVSNILTIDSQKSIKNLEVYNLAGQKVRSESKINNGKVDLSALTAGTYIIKVALENGQVETFKILKK